MFIVHSLATHSGQSLHKEIRVYFSPRPPASVDVENSNASIWLLLMVYHNPLTGQNVQDAMRQYRLDRAPKEPLLAFRRCLARFAVDPDLVYVTTHLAGAQTRFLPFNQGKFGSASNPLGHDALAPGPVPGQCGPRRTLDAEEQYS